jgi:hypothetical protein
MHKRNNSTYLRLKALSGALKLRYTKLMELLEE